jgi:ATP-dependent Lon protease
MLAAHRAGLKTVILPRRNEKDLEDVPEEVREELEFVLVDRIDQVFEMALCEPSPEWQQKIQDAANSGKRGREMEGAADDGEEKEAIE